MPFDNVPLREPNVETPIRKKQRLTEVQRALLRAADIIEWRGWSRLQMFSHGRVCILGGLQLAVHPDLQGAGFPVKYAGVYRQAIGRVASVLREDQEPDSLAYWNDNIAASGKEVVGVLRKAAKRRR